MDPRTFIGTLTGSLLSVPPAARAQQKERVRRIGLLSLADPEVTDLERQQFWAPARKLGWIEGDNLIVERRFASGRAELLQSFADELVRLKMDIIVTSGTDATVAAKNATTTIPIIMYSAGDPVRAGCPGIERHHEVSPAAALGPSPPRGMRSRSWHGR